MQLLIMSYKRLKTVSPVQLVSNHFADVLHKMWLECRGGSHREHSGQECVGPNPTEGQKMF